MTRLAHIGAGLAAFLAGVTVAPLDRPTATSHKDAQREADYLRSNRLLRMVRWKYPKPGHSVKQGQRMATKARNRRRSK